jgi:hypothetical protein
VPAIAEARARDMNGSFSALAIDTEKASIARPTPRSMLFSKKTNVKSIPYILT